MNFNALLLDLIVLIVFIWEIRRGYRIGFMRVLIECISWIAVLVLASMLSYFVAGPVYDTFFSGGITDAIASALTQNTTPEALAASLEETLASLPSAAASAVQFLLDQMQVDLSAVTGAEAVELAGSVAELVVRPILVSAIQFCAFLLFFVLGMVVFHIIAVGFGMFNSIPLVGGVNRLLGGFLGLVKGGVIVCLLLAALQLYLTVESGGPISSDDVESSFLAGTLYEHNPISGFLGR